MNTKSLLPLAFFALFVSNVFAQQLQIDSIDFKAAFCIGDCEIAMTHVSGGVGLHTYMWSNGANTADLTYCFSGVYSVTVTDATGSMAMGAFETVAYELFVFHNIIDVSCAGISDGEIEVFTAMGIPPYQYSLNGGAFSEGSVFSNLSVGEYDIIVVDSNGCASSFAATVSEMSPFEIEITTSENTATVTASGGMPPYTYQWNDSNMQTTASAVDLDEGIYSVTVTDALGCESVGTVGVLVGVKTPEYLTNFDISPNPSDGKFTIDLQFEVTQRATIQVLNTLGQEMYHFRDTQSHFMQTIDMHEAVAGTYFVVISTKSGRTVKRIVLM